VTINSVRLPVLALSFDRTEHHNIDKTFCFVGRRKPRNAIYHGEAFVQQRRKEWEGLRVQKLEGSKT
jgi:hypothetical protein